MMLLHPEWFFDLDSWWLPSAGKHLPEHVVPIGLDWRGQLYLEGDSRAWATQTQLTVPSLLGKLTEHAPWTAIIGAVVTLKPVVVLSVTSPGWNDFQAMDDAVLDTWHDAVEAYGTDRLIAADLRKVLYEGYFVRSRAARDTGWANTSLMPRVLVRCPDGVMREPDLCLVGPSISRSMGHLLSLQRVPVREVPGWREDQARAE